VSDPDERTFGARFLAEWKRAGGELGNWSYAEIQELRGLDREGMAEAVRRWHPLTPLAALQRIRSAESPESLARDILQQRQASAQTTIWLLLALLP
jgi:hypothetical protein